MLACAFLTIAAATEHTPAQAASQIPLTRNEIAGLFATLIIQPIPAPGITCAGLPGGGATSTAPKPATTSGKPGS